MIIECDTRQQKDIDITNYFDEQGIKWIRNKLYCGDYKRTDSITTIIDTKKDLLELSGNLCSKREHQRIKKELQRAGEIGCRKFVFLIADEYITDVGMVSKWQVPLNILGKPFTEVKPETLQLIMETMILRYGVEFMFVKKENIGQAIVQLLEGQI